MSEVVFLLDPSQLCHFPPLGPAICLDRRDLPGFLPKVQLKALHLAGTEALMGSSSIICLGLTFERPTGTGYFATCSDCRVCLGLVLERKRSVLGPSSLAKSPIIGGAVQSVWRKLCYFLGLFTSL